MLPANCLAVKTVYRCKSLFTCIVCFHTEICESTDHPELLLTESLLACQNLCDFKVLKVGIYFW